MPDLSDLIRSEANIADRPGQMDRLNRLADMVDDALAETRRRALGEAERAIRETPWERFGDDLSPQRAGANERDWYIGANDGVEFSTRVVRDLLGSKRPVRDGICVAGLADSQCHGCGESSECPYHVERPVPYEYPPPSSASMSSLPKRPHESEEER